MTPRAFIQGENHASQSDARRLYEHCTAETDALFVEGRSNTIQLEHHTMGYIIFLIGYLTLEILYRAIELLGNYLPNRGEWSIKTAARGDGLAVNDEIDAELHEIWASLADWESLLLRVGAFAFILLAVMHGINESPSILVPERLLPALMVTGTPFLYTCATVFALGDSGVRDEVMAQAIIEQSTEQNYDEVLVLCGDKHVTGIKQHLESEGWDVEDKRSSYRLLGLFD